MLLNLCEFFSIAVAWHMNSLATNNESISWNCIDWWWKFRLLSLRFPIDLSIQLSFALPFWKNKIEFFPYFFLAIFRFWINKLLFQHLRWIPSIILANLWRFFFHEIFIDIWLTHLFCSPDKLRLFDAKRPKKRAIL